MSRINSCRGLVIGLLVAFCVVGRGWGLGAASGGGQAPAQTGHREAPHDPPNVRRAVETAPTLPPAALTRNGHTSVQVNVTADGQNILGDAANEPSLAVDPTDPNIMVIGWRQFDDVNSDFRQAGWGYSHDGGQSWTFPGVLEPGVFRSDPVLAADNSGDFFYYSLGDDFTCHIFKSSDGGVTWAPGVFAWGGDKQWMTVDQTGGPSDGVVYGHWSVVVSTHPTGRVTRSFDGGVTFDGPHALVDTDGNALPSLMWGTSTVLSDGTLLLVGAREFGGNHVGPLLAYRSENAGDPFSVPTFSGSMLPEPVALWAGASANGTGLVGQAVYRPHRPGRAIRMTSMWLRRRNTVQRQGFSTAASMWGLPAARTAVARGIS
jgi:hypothetical protein